MKIDIEDINSLSLDNSKIRLLDIQTTDLSCVSHANLKLDSPTSPHIL